MQIITNALIKCQDIPSPGSNRPSILEVIGAHVQLRKTGAEYVGLCPFHSEKTPSFHVNDSKGVFYCHGCHSGGDVISFVQKIEGIDFKHAISRLGVESFRPSPAEVRAREEAGRIVQWARGISIRLRAALRDISDEIHVITELRKLPEADKPLLAETEASLIRQWAILCDFDDDMNEPKLMLEMWSGHESIESLLETVE